MNSKPLSIAIWGINYSPELTGIAPYNQQLAEFLAARGHEVHVVTTFAYYPHWRKHPDDRSKLMATESINGVRVHRCWHYVPHSVTTLKRIAHELSFVTTSLLRSLFLPKVDLAFVVSPPLALGAAAWLWGCLRRRPFVFHVQDLQPDAAVGLGMLAESPVVSLLYKLEKFAYSKASRVSGISPEMIEAFQRKGTPASQTLLTPNPIQLQDPASLPQRGLFRRRHGVADDSIIVLYSGNIGQKQGLDVVLEAAALLHSSKTPVVFFIVGEGAAKDGLVTKASELQLSNLRFLPLEPLETFHEMLVDADICLVPQKANSGAAFFPSKLLGILACQRPVITIADARSALAKAVEKGGFGINLPPDSPQLLAESILSLRAHPEQRTTLASKANLFVSQFSATTLLPRLEAALYELATKRTQQRDEP